MKILKISPFWLFVFVSLIIMSFVILFGQFTETLNAISKPETYNKGMLRLIAGLAAIVTAGILAIRFWINKGKKPEKTSDEEGEDEL